MDAPADLWMPCNEALVHQVVSSSSCDSHEFSRCAEWEKGSNSDSSCNDEELCQPHRDIEHKEDWKEARNHHKHKCSFENSTEMSDKAKKTMEGPASFSKLHGIPTIQEINSHLVTTESVVEWSLEEHPGMLKVLDCPRCNSKPTLNKTMLHCHSCATHGDK